MLKECQQNPFTEIVIKSYLNMVKSNDYIIKLYDIKKSLCCRINLSQYFTSFENILGLSDTNNKSNH